MAFALFSPRILFLGQETDGVNNHTNSQTKGSAVADMGDNDLRTDGARWEWWRGGQPFYANTIQPRNSTMGFTYRVALTAGCFVFAPVLYLDPVRGAEVLHRRQPHHVLLRDFHLAANVNSQ